MAQSPEGFQASFSADQQVMITARTLARGHNHRFLQTNGLDILDDQPEHPVVAFPGIKYLDLLKRNHAQFRRGALRYLTVHDALRIWNRLAMPAR